MGRSARRVRITNRNRGTELGDRVAVAETWWTRLRGLIGRPEPGPGEGLLIVPSQSVHMFWMKYPLDVAMLDREGTVLALYPELPPRRWTKQHWKAHAAVELPAGTLAETGTEVGDVLEWSGNGKGGTE